MKRIKAWLRSEPVLSAFLALAISNLGAGLALGTPLTATLVYSAVLSALGAALRQTTVADEQGTTLGRYLGRTPHVPDKRDLRLKHYLTSLTSVPASVDNSGAVKKWLMLLNDRLGDCVPAGLLHAIMLWTHKASGVKRFTATNTEALSTYEAVGRYVPGQPSTDLGCNERAALNYWRKTGVAGHKISAYAAVNPKNPDELRACVYWFGMSYLGVNLQQAQESQTTWDHVPGAPYVGGHCVILVAMDSLGNGKVVSWGRVYDVTWAFLVAQCEEAWAVLSPDWMGKDSHAPNGLDLPSLKADLAKLAA